MKLSITFLLVLFSFSIFAQSSSFSQKTLVTKRTASWCPNCGTWGWNFAKAIDELENENAILIRAHYSGDLQSKAAQDITENFKAVYQPEFYINEEVQSVGSTTWESKVADFNQTIDENASLSANVSTTILSSIDGETISVEVSATLLNDIEGDYFLGTYVLENGVENNQSGFGPAIHNRVLREAFTEDSFGEQMIEGSGSKGTHFVFDAAITPEGEALEDRAFEILVIVWKKEEEQYTVENVHVSAIGAMTNTETLVLSEAKFNVYQTGSDLVVDFYNKEKAQTSASFGIYTMAGEKVISTKVSIKNGDNHIIVPFSANFPPQLYVVKLANHSSKVLWK